ncbi:rRNA adenine N(6)-methyltransferase [Nucleospora cyclopteri]
MGIYLKKQEGQHILKNHGLIDTIIEKAKIKHTDTLLEIGAGTGSITIKLLQKAKKVVAYETDKRLAKELKIKANSMGIKNKLNLIEEDALRSDWPHFDIFLSNIPFNISLPIILKLLNYNFKCAFILVQKEFAERLVAKPGTKEYSRLSVITQLLTKVQHVLKVSKNSFVPIPKVDTCFVKIEQRMPRVEINVVEFDNLLKICFTRKNKTLLSNLKTSQMENYIKKSTEIGKTPFEALVEKIVESCSFKNMRPSKMAVEDFLKLLLEFKKIGIHFE